LFEDDLNRILRETYTLVSKLGFDAAYIDSTPPIEREIYLVYAKEEQAKQQKDNAPKDMILGTPIDPMNSPFQNPAT
jgi:hypothetical protein